MVKRLFGLSLAIVLLAACAHRAAAPSLPASFSRADISGANLEYSVSGHGEPVLLIHGSIFADAFAPLTNHPALTGYQVISYHRRGFAGSDRVSPPYQISQQASDAYEVLRHLGINRAHVVGHSYGALIALQLAVDHPDSVASLALFEPPMFLQTEAAAALFKGIGEAVAFHGRGDDETAIAHFVTTVAGLDRAVLDRETFETAVTDAPTFFNVELPAMSDWKFEPAVVNSLEIPVLIMVGANSRAAFHEAATELGKKLRNAESLSIPEAGHALQITHPDPVTKGLAAFLKRNRIR